MSLLQPQANLTQEQIDLAESIVAGELGMTNLEETPMQEEGVLGQSGLVHTGVPVASVQSLTFNEVEQTAVIAGHRSVGISPTVKIGSSGFCGGMRAVYYRISYTSGWTSANVPMAIKQAVLQQAEAQALFDERQGITSEKMGPVSRSYAQMEAIKPTVTVLIAPWKAPCY